MARASMAQLHDIVYLNVGGQHFATTRATLTRVPGNMLSVMLEHDAAGTLSLGRDHEDRVFIDRDGTHFRHVLNFLRDGSFPPKSFSHVEELSAEANFYQLTALLDWCRSRIYPPPHPDFHQRPGENKVKIVQTFCRDAANTAHLRTSSEEHAVAVGETLAMNYKLRVRGFQTPGRNQNCFVTMLAADCPSPPARRSSR